MTYHQVIQYIEREDNAIDRIVQRGSRSDESKGRYIAKERRYKPNGEWVEVEKLGEYTRSSKIDGNKSKPTDLYE